MDKNTSSRFDTASGPGLFVFDGDCGICTKSVEFLRHVVETDLRFIPYQVANLDDFGLTEQDCQRAAQVVFPNGGRNEGYDSFRISFLRSAHAMSRAIGFVMSIRVVRFVGRYIYSRVAQGRHTGALGDMAGACRLPETSPTQLSGSRSERWAKLAVERVELDDDLVDIVTQSRGDVMEDWGIFRRQAWLVSAQWAVGALLLGMRLTYDTVIGYGWGWQMFS